MTIISTPVAVQSIAMIVFVCLSVCRSDRSRISHKLHVQTSRILYVLSLTVSWSFSDDSRGIRYVLPVLWMTSRFPITNPMACGVSNIYVSAALEQVVINFQRVLQGAPHLLTLSSYITAANCTSGTKR